MTTINGTDGADATTPGGNGGNGASASYTDTSGSVTSLTVNGGDGGDGADGATGGRGGDGGNGGDASATVTGLEASGTFIVTHVGDGPDGGNSYTGTNLQVIATGGAPGMGGSGDPNGAPGASGVANAQLTDSSFEQTYYDEDDYYYFTNPGLILVASANGYAANAIIDTIDYHDVSGLGNRFNLRAFAEAHGGSALAQITNNKMVNGGGTDLVALDARLYSTEPVTTTAIIANNRVDIGAGDDQMGIYVLATSISISGNTLVGGAGQDKLYLNFSGQDGGYGASDDSVGLSIGADNSISGFEIVKSGNGNDILLAFSGDDTSTKFDLHGGDDTVSAGGGNDQVFGGDGNDTINGGDGDDRIDGEAGTDKASYKGASSAVSVSLVVTGVQDTGGAGSDTLVSIENLYGSSYGDTLVGSAGNNVLRGDIGNDTLNGGAGDDTLDGGAGSDKASYKGASAAVTVKLGLTSAQNTGGAGIDTLVAIENLYGSSYDDTLTGNFGGNSLYGDAGNDTLSDGGRGTDTLDGGVGFDTADFALNDTGGVRADISAGANFAQSGGPVTLVSIENLTGSSYADTLIGGDVVNVLVGGAGDDAINGGAGDDALDGGAGIDRASYLGAIAAVRVDLRDGTASGGAGNDTLTGFEDVTGSAFGDTLIGSDAANYLDGRDGADVLNGGLGADRLEGGAGSDDYRFTSTLGGGNIDTIVGFSLADDTISLSSGIFKGIAKGALAAAAFTTGTAATDTADRIVYNSDTGALLFDRDGSNTTYAAVQFATIGKNLALTAGSFDVF